jgi:hypothetical protein
MMEIWKEVAGFPDYLVSNLGNVKSIKINQEKILSKRLDTKGYVHYFLYSPTERKSFKGHRLVAMAFLPNSENKPQVNHINGVKTDNKIENLEWCTNLENARHAWANGRKALSGARHHKTKLNREAVLFIRENKSISCNVLAAKYGVAKSSILRVRHNKSHRDYGNL